MRAVALALAVLLLCGALSGCAGDRAHFDDSDGDGIFDIDDLCPETPNAFAAREPTNLSGCSLSQGADWQDKSQWWSGLDPDGDGFTNGDHSGGVPSLRDMCPGTPAGEAVDSRGCSMSEGGTFFDSDGDGLLDIYDLCAETPADEVVDESGCSASERDSDGDGLVDAEDSLPLNTRQRDRGQ